MFGIVIVDENGHETFRYPEFKPMERVKYREKTYQIKGIVWHDKDQCFRYWLIGFGKCKPVGRYLDAVSLERIR